MLTFAPITLEIAFETIFARNIHADTNDPTVTDNNVYQSGGKTIGIDARIGCCSTRSACFRGQVFVECVCLEQLDSLQLNATADGCIAAGVARFHSALDVVESWEIQKHVCSRALHAHHLDVAAKIARDERRQRQSIAQSSNGTCAVVVENVCPARPKRHWPWRWCSCVCVRQCFRNISLLDPASQIRDPNRHILASFRNNHGDRRIPFPNRHVRMVLDHCSQRVLQYFSQTKVHVIVHVRKPCLQIPHDHNIRHFLRQVMQLCQLARRFHCFLCQQSRLTL
mmetsp:Transcript_10655/g.19220  ORF Transcript_10655/g.19220 Transcript_10655/m.19220 type:complete len:282 (-) Transcript_10655:816-1661(-)